MRNKIIELGRIKVVTLITLFSISVSVIIYIAVMDLMAEEINSSGLIVSFLAPMIIAPTVSWIMLELIIKIHHLEIQMRELATYDSLTKVMSRKAFLTNSESLHQFIKREQLSLAMLYLDIDDFKKINDTYGHAVGDEVLKSFGKILDENRRESDIVGRLGGEEFAFVLPKTDAKGAVVFADNLRNIINNQQVKYNDTTITYTVSIGVSIFDKHNLVGLHELTTQADEALYVAKKSGKNCTIAYQADKSEVKVLEEAL